MKTFTAYTYEIDDVEAAVSEILSQLDLEALCKNSVGIINCYSEFLDSGVVEALNEALPFNTIGTTTLAGSTSGELSFTMLSLMVLTGDDVSFSTALSDEILEEQEKPLMQMCRQALAGIEDEAKLAMVYIPVIPHIGGDVTIEAMEQVLGGIPIFGTCASDHTDDYHSAQVIYNGKAYKGEVATLLIGGNIEPRFSVMSIPEKKVLRQKAIVTESLANQIISVNNMSFLEYLHTIGLVEEDTSLEGVMAIPVMIDYNNGTEPIAMGMFLGENGTAACGCKVPVGASLSIGTLLAEDIVAAAQTVVQQILEQENCEAAIMYPCLSRILILGIEPEAEMEKISSGLSDKVPYTLAYSTGEICPVKDKDGKFVNRMHNFSLISCIF